MIYFQAYDNGLFGPKVVWIFLGYLSKYFWRVDLDDVHCTLEDMEQVADGMFLTKFTDINPIPERGIANVTCMLFSN